MLKHEIYVDGQTYILYLVYKKIRTVIFRVHDSKSNTFKVSLPYGTRLSELEKVFSRNYKSLLKLQKRHKTVPFDDKTYYFGQLINLADFFNRYGLKEDEHTSQNFYKLTKKELTSYLKKAVEHYRLMMNIPVIYKTRIRAMKTRWATNSRKTMTLSFNEKMVHFAPSIIDGLIVHELAHYYISGHGEDFYQLVNKYYKDYTYFDKMLKEHQYEGYYKSSKS